MKGRSLLLKLADKGITVKHDAGKLKFFGDVAKLTNDDKAQIVAAKQDIIDYLTGQTNNQPKITKADSADKHLSFAQQRLWFIDSLQGQSSEYNMPTAFAVKGNPDMDLLASVFTAIIERHEILRTCYRQKDGKTEQHVRAMADIDFTIDIEDLSHLTRETLDQNLQSAIEQSVAKPFSLANDLMLRVSYWSTATDEGVLLFNMHHIASDGWSMEVLTKEFFALYQAFSAGQANPLPELAIQYADFGHWQRTHLEGEVLESQLDFWQKQLDEAPPLHGLPLDYPRPPTKQYVGAKVSGALPSHVAEGLLALAKTHQLTPFMLLHGALALLLSRHSHQKDIVIGTPVANRLQSELEPLIGFFVNTLVLRVDTDQPDLNHYFEHIRKVHQQAQSNQDVPFEQLVERLNVTRDLAYSPIFQLVLTTSTNYGVDGRTDADKFDLPGMAVSPYTLGTEQAKFDLNIDLNISEQGVGLNWVYDVSLFSEAHIEQLNEHLCTLLTALSQKQWQQGDALRRLPMLNHSETEHLLYELNDSKTGFDEAVCIHQLFEQQAQAHPERPALSCDDVQLSYGQLNEKANQLAHYLQQNLQVDKDMPVGLCLPRKAEMIVAILAVLKSGGAYVPLDPANPSERIEFILSDTGAPVVLVSQETKHLMAGFAGATLPLDGMATGDDHMFADYGKHNLNDTNITPEHLAYVIYTSGSTGKPKGVEVEHRAVVAFLSSPTYADAELAGKVASFSSYAFDGFIYDLFFSLTNGAELFLYDKQLVLHIAQLKQRLKEDGVNNFFTTTALFNQLVGQDAFADSNIKQVLFGGERCDDKAINKFKTRYPDISLVHVYGPTEAIVFATNCRVDQYNGSFPIGKALNNNKVLVLDQFGNLAPKGCLGELYIGGESLARGYLNRPELTVERFIENPFFQGRLYRTGDLVRMLDDGNIEFVGRTDDQVKIRGFRIELDEVSNQLAAIAQVDSAIAMVKPLAGSDQLVAYVKPEQAIEQDNKGEFVASVLDELKANLPEYMVPSALAVVDQWPLTANNKVDKRALPEIGDDELRGQYVEPVGDTQLALVDIWADILGIKAQSISADANFFELGGHSLLTMRLISGIAERFEVELPIQTVFDSSTLAELATCIEQSVKGVNRPPLLAIERISNQMPVSFAQQRLWFIDSLKGGSPEYNVPIAFEIQGQLDLSVLNRVFQTIIERHEILRTVYLESDEGTLQHIRDAEAVDFNISFTDLSGLQAAEQDEQIKALVEADITQSFDLTQDLMLRVGYLKRSQDSAILLFNMHHIASDGWSMEVLTKELFALYEAYQQDLPNPLKPLPVQYADYAQWQRDYLAGEQIEAQLDYWSEQLDDLPTVHSLPLDNSRPEMKQSVARMVTGRLPADVAKGLLNVAKHHQVTPFMLFHGALSLVLSRHSNSHDIVIGTPVAGRLLSEVEPLIGFFINNLVLRVNTQHQQLSDYLNHIKQVHLDAQSNQDVPFEQLVERLQVPRSTAYTPLFQIQLTTSNDFGVDGSNDIEALKLGDAQCTPYQADVVQIKSDLNVDLAINEQGVGLNWTYDVSLFNQAHIEQINNHLCRLLEGLSEAVGSTLVARLPMLSDAETQAVLFDLNDTFNTYDTEKCVHQLFTEHALANPEQIALTYQNTQLSYGELNRKANQLAHYLRDKHQIKPDALVGLCVERSLEMVIGIMGILKAGGAYVPLDPSYPQDRISYMLEDAAMDVVLTQTQVQDVLNGFNGTVVAMNGFGDSESHFISEYAALEPADNGLNSNHLAYVIYTSGSTGKPKGVMVEHQALFNRIAWMNNEYQMSTSDKVLQKTPYSFDVSVWEFVWTLGYGGQLVVAKPEGHKDPEYLCQLIQSAGITKLHFVPSMLGVILESDNFKHCHSIKQVFCSGEALQQGHVTGYRQALPEAQLHNLYGPTEAAIDVSYWDCSGDISRGVPIGKPIENIQLVVLDSDLNLVPKGAVGELHVGGDGLARGYLNREALTSERFIKNPYYDAAKANSSKRLYKTGDLARIRDDNEIEYQGRTDFQVKIRGLRIELGEIEHQLGGLENVDSALVMAAELSGSMQLIGYVKATTSIEQAQVASFVDQVKSRLSEDLPEHMVPGIIMVLDEWPTTPNGKVDRKALPAPDGSALQGEYIAPQGDNEQLLAAIWGDLLSIDSQTISANANFFTLGGHSLMGLKLVTRLRNQNLNLTINDILDSQSLAEMAARINRQAVLSASVSKIPAACQYITPDMVDLVEPSQSELDGLMEQVTGGAANIQDIYPLSPLQQGIFYQSLVHQDIDRYITFQTFNIQGESEYQNFINSFEHLIKQHDILRTSFHWDNLSQPVQVVERDVDLPLSVLADAEDADAVVKARLSSREFKFNIQKAPMINVTVCKQLGSDSYTIGLEFHHLVDDNIAIGIFVSQLEQTMNGDPVLVTPEKQYRNYIERVINTPLNDAKDFFRQSLSDVQEMSFVFDIKDQHDISTEKQLVKGEKLARIKAAAKAHNIQLPTLMHTAWAMVVAATSSKDKVVFGSVLSGRMGNAPGMEDMVGPLINTLPLVVDFNQPSQAALFANVDNALKQLVKYDYMPLTEAKACFDYHISGEMFNAIVNYRYVADKQTLDEIAGVEANELMHYPFALSVDDGNNEMLLTVFAPPSIGTSRMMQYLDKALEAIVDNVEQSQLPQMNLPEQELAQLLYGLNDSQFEYPQDACIHELFEQQVSKTPDAIAVALDDKYLTYAQLNERANALAWLLRQEHNVKPQQLVGICVERSLEMVVGIMAILKAGGAYVPIEPSYPADRIEHILTDADLTVVLMHNAVAGKVDFCVNGDNRALVNLDELSIEGVATENLTRPEGQYDSKALAYVIYTSGSTGLPKGVLIEHQSLVYSTLCRFDTYSGLSAFLLLSNMSFDSSVAGIFSTLCSGAKLCLVAEGKKDNVSYIVQQLEQQAISHFLMVPSFYDVILSELENRQLPALRGVTVAGEGCGDNVVAKHYQVFSNGVQLFNEYGPTEGTVWATVAKLNHNEKVTIGKAIPGKALFVMNNGALVPLGAAGELFIGGEGLARGYLNRDDLTAERFIDNPYYDDNAANSVERLYATGDLVRFLADGELEFLGRADDQVKIRGFRIELGEVESALSALSGVDSALVMAQEFAGSQQLVAYVKTLENDLDNLAFGQQAKTQLAQQLPDYMVPTVIISVPQWPLTPNGKIDKKALPKPDSSLLQGEYVAPENDIEQQLTHVWAELLKFDAEGISATANFFELGGNSLLSIRLMAKLNQTFDINLDMEKAFSLATLRDLAMHIEELKSIDKVQLDEEYELQSDELELTI